MRLMEMQQQLASTEARVDPPPCLLEIPSKTMRYTRGAVIFRPEEPADCVFRVVAGRIKLSCVSTQGRESVLNIFTPGEVFGEMAALGAPRRQEQASALDEARLISWSAVDVTDAITTHAELAAWFAQVMAFRLRHAHLRIETLSFDPIPKRLARVILQNADRFGTAMQDGRVRMLPFTHEALAQQVATSREIVTHYMNSFRDQGFLEYSRKSIDVCPKRLSEVLQSQDGA